MLREVLLLVGAYFAFFAFVMVLVRVDLTIDRTTVAASAGKVAATRGVLVAIQKILSQRNQLHDQLDANLRRYIGDLNLQRLNSEHGNTQQSFIALVADVEKRISAAADTEIVAPVRELEREEAKKLTNHLNLLVLERRFQEKKVSRDHYAADKKKLQAAYQESTDLVETISDALVDDYL
eukprot:TRINITY_DN2959_c0_g1_i2.p1 TRINITY_DN2959_c0_g1~~TRINITY_DN2959_c0_g1_i2.p1  ORF type:complete len:180 (-),score=50.63 TRINITY_DN2959_c0_g1_i2:29-568(-)